MTKSANMPSLPPVLADFLNFRKPKNNTVALNRTIKMYFRIKSNAG